MLQNIRNGAKSWAAKIIIGVMVAAMALFGVESLFSVFGEDPDEAAKVNGESISRQQVALEVQRTMRSGTVPPEQERALSNDMLNQLITQRLLTQYAEDGHFQVSDSQLDQLIVSLDEFKDQDGKFSAELFRNRLGSAGYTPLAFRTELRSDIMRRQLQQGLASSDFTLDFEQARLAELQRQLRSFRYVMLTPDNTAIDVSPTTEDIEAYYDANTARFKRPEQVRVNYIVIDRQAMADNVELSEDELRAEWRAQNDDTERRIAHIMVGFGDERSREEASAIADKALDDLNEGESFADTAARYSDDTASAENGGDLGNISEGFLGESFDDVAFSLSEGDVSDPVEVDDALHIIKVTGVNRPPFEQQRDKLRQQMAGRQVDGEFNERVQHLIDESFAADDLQSVADDIDATVEHSDWLGQDGGDGVLSEPGVMDEAFSDDVLEEGYNSEVIELDEDRRLVLRIAEYREATTLPLDQVRDEVAQRVQARQQQEALTRRADTLIDELKTSAGTGDNADLSDDLRWRQANDILRQDDTSVSRNIVDAAFRMPKPEDGQTTYRRVAVDDGVALIALERVSQGEANAEAERFVSQMTEQLRGQAVTQGLIDYLHDEASIKKGD